MRDAPVVGGVNVTKGNGEIIRMRRGASISDFADKIETLTGYTVQPGTLVTILFNLGEMATATESLDEATFEVLGAELGYKIQMVSPEDEDKELLEGFGLDLDAELENEDEDDLEIRPPVVTVMGHVDHGKTRLLDAIRQTNVVAGEAGGITQHIGAYQVWTEHEGIERAITFIDTPGHEAFTAMRARGAQVTDLAILVVAADDGIMPQTVEALNHAQAAGVPIVVAVNKIDKPDANPAKVRQQLTEYGLVAEEYGGDVIFVDVSARAGTNIQELLDAVLLTADAGLDLTANPNKAARGVAIEAKLDKGRGSVATVLIQSGTLRVGDAIVAGTAYGRVRAMADENGDPVLEAWPSRPVQVQGLNSVPRAGDTFIVTDEDRLARQIAEKREAAERNAQLAKARKRISLEDFTRALQEGKVESLNLIIKGDVSGAVEALEESLLKIEVDESVQLRIIHRGVGAITESDVNLATIDNAIIIGFNVRPDTKARERASREGVDTRFYSVIYNAIDDVEQSLKGMLKPEFEEVQSGVAEIREVFRSSKFGNIAGVIVRSGTITRNAKARVIRDGVVIADGLAIESLRRFKDDVTEVRTDFEAGIGLGKFNDIQIGDEIETTEMVREAARLVLRAGRRTMSPLRQERGPYPDCLSGDIMRLLAHERSRRLAVRKRKGKGNGRQQPGRSTERPHPSHPGGAPGARAPRSSSGVRHDHRRQGDGRPAARVGVLHGARHRGGAPVLRRGAEGGDRDAALRGGQAPQRAPDPVAGVHRRRDPRERRTTSPTSCAKRASATRRWRSSRRPPSYAGDADPYVKPREFDEAPADGAAAEESDVDDLERAE